MMRLIKKEALRNKSSRIVFVLVAAVAVLSVGYIMALAVLAPEQLAEATAAASDLVCSGCVGTTDIANSAVTSAKIGSGQVANSDIATSAVTTGKISDTAGVQSVDIVNGQVSSADIKDATITSTDIAPGTIPSGSTPADNSVTSAKIVDGEVHSVDIGDAAITAQDIAEGTITGGNIKGETIQEQDIAPGAIIPNVIQVVGDGVTIGPNNFDADNADCPPGYILTGGGFRSEIIDKTTAIGSYPIDADTWVAFGYNESTVPRAVHAVAVCIGPSP